MIHKLLKLHPVLPFLFLSYVYIVSGIFVNILQLLVFIFIRTLSNDLGTRLNGYLQASHIAILTCVVEWHCECDIRCYFDPEDLEHINKEHTICMANHYGEVDWLLGYVLLGRLGGLKGCKVAMKQEIQYLPVVGWLMWFSDYLFLSRNWNRDQSTISRICGIWSKCHPVQNSNFIVVMAEGTRFTAAKHEASVAFCKERGYKPFRNVLYPRTKGATEIICQLGDSLGSVYNVVFAFPGQVKPDHKTMFAGTKTSIDISIRREPASSIPKDDRESISEFIVQHFREKDELLDYHKLHGKFPGEARPLPRSKICLALLYFWSLVAVIPGVLCLHFIVVNGTLSTWTILIFLLVLGGLVAKRIITAVMLSRSSSYGTEKFKKI